MTGILDVGLDGFALPLDYATRRTAMLAKPRVGKSNAAVRIAEEFTRLGIPWIAIDPKGDWWGVRSSSDGSGPGLSVPIFGGEHGDVPLEPRSGKVIGELIVEKRLSGVLDVSDFNSRQEMWGFLIDLGETLLRRNREVLHIFLDECDEYLPQKHAEGGNQPKALSVWSRVVSKGGQKGIGVTLISQRSAFVNKDVLWLVDAMVAFNTFSPKDRATVAEWFTDKGGASQRDFAAGLRSLDKGQAWVFAPGWMADEPLLVRFQRRTTFDSGATPAVGDAVVAPATVADIDIAALGATIAATVERVKADDPKVLRARIAELEREVDRQSHLHGLDHSLADQWQQERDALQADRDALRRIVDTQMRIIGNALGILEENGKIAAEMRQTMQPAPPPPPPLRIVETKEAPRRPVPAPPRRPASSAPDTLSDYQRALLTAVAQRHPAPSTRAQVARLSGKSIKSSAFGPNLRALLDAGYVEGDPMRITASGFDVLGGYEAPPTGAALLDWWCSRVSPGEAVFLRALVAAFPATLSREDLAERTGRSLTSSAFTPTLRDLVDRELIDEVERGVYRASGDFSGPGVAS